MDNRQIKQIIGQKIRHYRTIKTLTQKELAAEIGVASSFIANIEQGQKGISLNKMVDICEWFNIALSDLLPIETQNDKEEKDKIINETVDLLKVLETTQLKLFKIMVAGISTNLSNIT